MFTSVDGKTTTVGMSKIPRISDAEWKVMEVVWDGPPVTAQHVLDVLGESEGWKTQTVKTLLGRLVKKGALSFVTEANRYLYSPCFTREVAVKVETGSFLERITRGSVAPLLAHLVQSPQSLSAEELATLRALLEDSEKEESR